MFIKPRPLRIMARQLNRATMRTLPSTSERLFCAAMMLVHLSIAFEPYHISSAWSTHSPHALCLSRLRYSVRPCHIGQAARPTLGMPRFRRWNVGRSYYCSDLRHVPRRAPHRPRNQGHVVHGDRSSRCAPRSASHIKDSFGTASPASVPPVPSPLSASDFPSLLDPRFEVRPR